MTTSGLGSEVSDSDTRADDMFSLCGSVRFGWQSEETESLPPDDGVFTDPQHLHPCMSPTPPPPPPAPPVPAARSRPRPSSLLGITPAREMDWKPPPTAAAAAGDDSFAGTVRSRPRPTSLNPVFQASALHSCAAQLLPDPAPCSSSSSSLLSASSSTTASYVNQLAGASSEVVDATATVAVAGNSFN